MTKKIRWQLQYFLSISLVPVLFAGNGRQVVAQPSSINFKTFADWCKAKESLPSDARHTVEVLLTSAKTARCDRAEVVLTRSTKLILTNQQIKNLHPLSTLQNLKELTLSGNQITDLRPLSTLTHLKELSLQFNQISEIKPLAKLTQLEVLDLSANQITDVQPLAALTNLFWLGLNRNRVAAVEPLSTLVKLESLALAGNQVTDVASLSPLKNLIYLFLEQILYTIAFVQLNLYQFVVSNVQR